MSKFVVVVFPDEAKAYEGLNALKELDAEDSLTVYAGAVIVKEADGTVSLKERHGRRPFGAAVGAVLGGLIGLIGGPAVAAVGAAGGALAGGWRDALNVGVDLDFLDEVSRELTPGKSAIVAEIEEDWVTPLDSRMEAAGGVVLRSWRDLEDERIRREAERRRAELAQLQAERAQAREEWQSNWWRASRRRGRNARTSAIGARPGSSACRRRPTPRSKPCKIRRRRCRPTRQRSSSASPRSAPTTIGARRSCSRPGS